MTEIWLRTNRRAFLLGMVLPGVLVLVGVSGVVWAVMTRQHWALQLLIVLVTAVPLWMVGELLYALTRPRLGYEAGDLLVFFEPTRAMRVPIEIVEVFFLGQGPSTLPKLK